MNIVQPALGLRRRKEELTRRMQKVAADLCRSRETHGGLADQVAQRYNAEVLTGILSSANDELGQIDSALHRITEGCYETCVRCGSRIPLSRLKAVPYTDHCAGCGER